MQEVRVDLDPPRHGWMGMAIRIGATRWEGDASYVCDTFYDLLCAALDLDAGATVRPVLVFQEPDTYRIDLVPAGDDVRITISHHADLSPARAGQAGTISLAATVSRAVLLRAIADAVHRLEAKLDRPSIAAAWGHPYPADEVERLIQSS